MFIFYDIINSPLLFLLEDFITFTSALNLSFVDLTCKQLCFIEFSAFNDKFQK